MIIIIGINEDFLCYVKNYFIVNIENFEEGELPKRLFHVTLKKI